MMNFYAILVAALVPTAIGFIWYHPKVFGTLWMKENGFTEEGLKAGNFLLIFGISLLLSFMLSFFSTTLFIHQFHVGSVFQGMPGLEDPSTELGAYYADFMAKYGNNFRTFKHGVLHGAISSIFLVLPIIGINALYERKSFKYILLHVGFWMLTLMLMGGIISAWQ
jgi:hypothetical protein